MPATRLQLLPICAYALLLSLSGPSAFAVEVTPSLYLTQDDPRLTPARLLTVDQEGFTQVIVDGYIHQPTVDAFRAKVTEGGSDFGIVYFNSAGGDLSAAQELGRLIRAKGYATQIGKLSVNQERIERGVCESACPIAFIGGKFRLLDTDTGQLGVHRFYLARQGRWASDSKVLFTAERDLRTYIGDMGINPEFFDLMMRTPADRIQNISKSSAYYWSLGTGGDFSSWNYDADGQLIGLGESSTGGMAMTFRCKKGEILAQVRIKPWFPPAALLNYDTHSITVNGAKYPVDTVEAGFDKATGFLTFETTVGESTKAAFQEAESVGYSLSYEHSLGEYSRSLRTDDGGKALAQLSKNCATIL